MTLEQRAKEIADIHAVFPGPSRTHADLQAAVLRHLREAVDEALARAGRELLSHADWVGL